MCKESKKELMKGKALAIKLVQHLIAMNADKCTFPIEYNGKKYEIIAKKLDK